MSDPLKISEMQSRDEEYSPNGTHADTLYDAVTGSVTLAAPVAYYLEDSTPSQDFDERSALPFVEMGTATFATITHPVSLNGKTSAIGLLRHHLSQRRRVMKTGFECKSVSKDLEPFQIVELDANGFFIDDTIVQNRYQTGKAWFDFGYVTAGYVDIVNEVITDPANEIKPVGRKKLNQWGDRVRFGVSLVAPLALDSHFAAYVSQNLRLNVGFGTFLSRFSDDPASLQPDDTAASHGLSVNVRNGTFVVDWSFANNEADILGGTQRDGSYDTGILAGSELFNGGEISIVLDIDLKVGLKITFATPLGVVATISFPLLDPLNENAGMMWTELFGDGGVASLPHTSLSVGQLNDNYYKVCCILQEFFNPSFDGFEWHNSVAFGMSRQQYPFLATNDAGLAEQQVQDNGDPVFAWDDYSPTTFNHRIELKGMYFESEFDVDSDKAEAFGNRFNLAMLGREPLRELDVFVESGGNAQYPE